MSEPHEIDTLPPETVPDTGTEAPLPLEAAHEEKLVAEYEAAAAAPAPELSAEEKAAAAEDWAELSRLRGLSHADGPPAPRRSVREHLRSLRAQQSEGGKAS